MGFALAEPVMGLEGTETQMKPPENSNKGTSQHVLRQLPHTKHLALCGQTGRQNQRPGANLRRLPGRGDGVGGQCLKEMWMHRD